MSDKRRLSPNATAKTLFGIAIDRDERASQICAETLLTLVQNDYRATSGESLRSPKMRRFALRSLAVSGNFLDGLSDQFLPGTDISRADYGEALMKGEDLRGSSNLRLVKQVLEGLIDPSTQKGQKGAWLLMPFHRSLLWYDARRTPHRPWGVRKVYMRGSGITLARLLADPSCDDTTRSLGRAAVEAIAQALGNPTPLGRISEHLEGPVSGDSDQKMDTEQDEIVAWDDGSQEQLKYLAEQICRHAEGIMMQGGSSGPAKLWQLRTMLALDLACHALRRAWQVTGTDVSRRYLLLSFGGPPRAQNVLRQRSEDSFLRSLICLREATIDTLAAKMHELSKERSIDWIGELESRRQQLDEVARKLRSAKTPAQFESLAREAFERATYDRSVAGFRVLLESVGMLSGTGQYRYLTATPDLLSAMVGALSADMPMEADDFFQRASSEWAVVISRSRETDLRQTLDGSELARNGRRAERIMVDSGLALGLSDRTTLVGERTARR
jgi:hypothetical protein